MAFQVLTADHYNAALDSFRLHPGNILKAAQRAGISRPTARKLWSGPLSPSLAQAGLKPCVEVVRAEAIAEQKAQAAREQEERRIAAEELDRHRKLEAEAARMEENAMRLARNNLLGGLGALAQLVPGLKNLSLRLNTMLETGVDANGNAIELKPEQALRIFQRFSVASRDLTLVGKVVIELHRAQEGMGSGAGSSIVEPTSLEESRDLLASAQQALERAERQKKLGQESVPGVELEVDPDAEDDSDEPDEDAPPAEGSTIGQGDDDEDDE